MPIEIRKQTALVSLICSGRVGNADLVTALRDVAASPDFGPRTPVFIDDSAATYRPEMAEIRETGQVMRELRELHGHRIGVLVTSPVSYGLGRMVEAFTDFVDVEIRTFRDREELMAWLRAEPCKKSEPGQCG